MNKQQYEVNNLPTQIVIGHQTETGVTSIYFDCTSWLASWPDLVLGVWVTQPGGTAAYPAATHMEGDVLVWDVTDSDTAVPGTGTMEIVGITTGKKKLSAIAKTKIMPTTTGTTTTPPEGEKAWVDAVIQAAGDAETSKSQAATYAQNAAASAEKAEENAKSVTWETLSGKPSTFPPDSHTHTLESLGAATAEEVSKLKNEIGVQNYTYNGRDLSVIFGTLSALHAAVSAGDFSKIRVGDYWPIMLNGIIKDYASGETKALNNAVFKLEVAPQVYMNYTDNAVPNHLLMCSRDLLPWQLMYRSEYATWYDGSQTNPWLGSHLYQSLNASDGILPLVEAIFGSYMYAGPNGKGMRFMHETKLPGVASATSRDWGDRGKLFIPTEREVWGQDVLSEHEYGGGAAVQWPFFAGSLRHIIKGLGNGGSRCSWWCQSSCTGSESLFTAVSAHGFPANGGATDTWFSVPLCFLFV